MRIAFNVVLRVWILAQKFGKVLHVLRPNMAFIWTGMHRNTLRAGVKTAFGCRRDRRETQVASIANQRHLVDINGQGGGGSGGNGFGLHVLHDTITIFRKVVLIPIVAV